MDAQAIFRYKYTYIPKLGSLYFFKLKRKAAQLMSHNRSYLRDFDKLKRSSTKNNSPKQKVLTLTLLAISASDTPSAAFVPARITEGSKEGE